MDSAMLSWIRELPKVELHMHLEGAIPLDALWALLCKYGGDPTVPDRDALIERMRYRDFTHFLRTWSWKNRFIREYEDLELVAEAVARQLAGERIVYVEAFYSPPDFVRLQQLNVGKQTEAIRRGLSRVPEIEVRLIADLVRDYGPDEGMSTLHQLAELREYGVIGIGIGGSEDHFPPEAFREVYAEARKLGLHTTAHAGEAAGAQSIWGAIRALEVERIGHGTRAFEDPALIEHLAETKLPLEMCPWSNVCTGVVPSLAEHPIRRYFDQGLMVTINTDDPGMFGRTLSEEYAAVAEAFAFERRELLQILRNAIDASWLSAEEKAARHRELVGAS